MTDVVESPPEALTTEAFRLMREAREPGDWIRLDGMDLHGVTFEPGTDDETLERIDFTGSTLTGCSFKDVYLRNVKFQDATLIECDLRYAEIERTSFKRAELVRCDLYRARLGTGAVSRTRRSSTAR
ncbi:pentapeptide repeat-containing protein [Aeromicrobium sp. UC242_57]|uniref:pentapeptide repeat-containing protein n=1 Tax=Aeromicrobium sp. UC242_57 TaxID=3374624 RepID=UPI0037A229B6